MANSSPSVSVILRAAGLSSSPSSEGPGHPPDGDGVGWGGGQWPACSHLEQDDGPRSLWAFLCPRLLQWLSHLSALRMSTVDTHDHIPRGLHPQWQTDAENVPHLEDSVTPESGQNIALENRFTFFPAGQDLVTNVPNKQQHPSSMLVIAWVRVLP